MLVRHMADSGDECQLAAAMAVSPALDIGAIYEHFSGERLPSMPYTLFSTCASRDLCWLCSFESE